jgi:uncharacterized protein (TIGR02145 family)
MSTQEIFMRGLFTDLRDGHTYKIIKLRDGNWWMAENLKYEMPGSFPADEKPSENILATNPDYDWRKYGRLYTWEAARKASPPGWHLPSDREWKKMLNLYGGYGVGVGNEPKRRNWQNDTQSLIRNELCVEFGGYLNTANSSDRTPPYAYGYFYSGMGGRFWSTTRQFSFSIRGGIYYRFLQQGPVCRDCENREKAFSVRCIANKF